LYSKDTSQAYAETLFILRKYQSFCSDHVAFSAQIYHAYDRRNAYDGNFSTAKALLRFIVYYIYGKLQRD